jgi:hypothetical protein
LDVVMQLDHLQALEVPGGMLQSPGGRLRPWHPDAVLQLGAAAKGVIGWHLQQLLAVLPTQVQGEVPGTPLQQQMKG